MDEKTSGDVVVPRDSASFNPHHTGEWLKSKNFDIIKFKVDSFNPHHTGEWLKSRKTEQRY